MIINTIMSVRINLLLIILEYINVILNQIKPAIYKDKLSKFCRQWNWVVGAGWVGHHEHNLSS